MLDLCIYYAINKQYKNNGIFEKIYYINIDNIVELVQFTQVGKHSEQNNNFDWTGWTFHRPKVSSSIVNKFKFLNAAFKSHYLYLQASILVLINLILDSLPWISYITFCMNSHTCSQWAQRWRMPWSRHQWPEAVFLVPGPVQLLWRRPEMHSDHFPASGCGGMACMPWPHGTPPCLFQAKKENTRERVSKDQMSTDYYSRIKIQTLWGPFSWSSLEKLLFYDKV